MNLTTTEFDFSGMRRAMVNSQLRTGGVNSPRILSAFTAVQRESFVSSDQVGFAYMDRAIPLGHGRFLNPAPTTGLMLEKLNLRSTERVLLLGAGTGYVAELLRRLAGEVVAVEGNDELFSQGKQLAVAPNIHWIAANPASCDDVLDQEQPFDAVFIDGAVETVPEFVGRLLTADGRLVCGLSNGAVTQLAFARAVSEQVTLVPFAEAEISPLAEFNKVKGFSF